MEVYLNKVIRWGPDPVGLVSLQEETQESSLHTSRGKAMEGHSEKVVLWKQEESSPEIKLAKDMVLDRKKIRFGCLSTQSGQCFVTAAGAELGGRNLRPSHAGTH